MTGEQPLEARLADLQRVTEVGFARVDGKLAVFETRDQSSALLEEQHRQEMQRLSTRVENLENKIARAVGISIGASMMLSITTGFIIWVLSHK